LQLYPTEPTGNLARHLKTLAALVCGIVGSKKVHLPAVAGKSPDKSRRESRAKRFARFLQNKSITFCKTKASRLASILRLLPRRLLPVCRPARLCWSWTAVRSGADAWP